jgi:hypothetical protein
MQATPIERLPIFKKGAPQMVRLAVLLLAFILCNEIYFFAKLILATLDPGFFKSTKSKQGAAFLYTVMVSWLLFNAALMLGLIAASTLPSSEW